MVWWVYGDLETDMPLYDIDVVRVVYFFEIYVPSSLTKVLRSIPLLHNPWRRWYMYLHAKIVSMHIDTVTMHPWPFCIFDSAHEAPGYLGHKLSNFDFSYSKDSSN